MKKNKTTPFIVSIIDNPQGLHRSVLQLLEQENRPVKYIDIPLGIDFSLQKVPLSYWEIQVESKLKKDSTLIDPVEPKIYHGKTMERLDIRPVQLFLANLIQRYILEPIPKKRHKNERDDINEEGLLEDLPFALLSPKRSLWALYELMETYVNGPYSESHLSKFTSSFFREYPQYFER